MCDPTDTAGLFSPFEQFHDVDDIQVCSDVRHKHTTFTTPVTYNTA